MPELDDVHFWAFGSRTAKKKKKIRSVCLKLTLSKYMTFTSSPIHMILVL